MDLQKYPNLCGFCKNCKGCRVAKLDGPIDEKTGQPSHKTGDFIVPCEGMPSDFNFVPNFDNIKHTFSPDEIELSKSLYDPVLWAKINLNWEPRVSKDGEEFQANMLRCTSKRKVFRLGRRLGKCVWKDSPVLTKRGLIPIKDLQDTDCLGTVTGNTKLEWTNAFIKNSNGTQPIYKLTTRLGSIDYVTDNHPYLVLTPSGLHWAELRELKAGDRIATPRSYEKLFPQETTDRELFRTLGYLISDGGTNYKNCVKFTNISDTTINDFNECLKQYGCVLSQYKDSITYGIKRIVRTKKPNPICELLQKHKMNCLAIHKKVPEIVYSANNGDVAEFLGAAWDCDGWVTKDEIGYCSASYDLANGIKHLLKRFGINARLRKRDVKYQDGFKIAYSIELHNQEDFLRFAQCIKLVSKKDKLIAILEARDEEMHHMRADWLHLLPKEFHCWLDEALAEKGLVYKDIARDENDRQRKQYGLRYAKLADLNLKLQDPFLSEFLLSDLLFDEVDQIEYVFDDETIDLTVKGEGNFITNDLVTHNSELLAIKILHYLFTNSPTVQRWDKNLGKFVQGFSTILVLAPYLSQIQLIFNRIKQLLATNPLLENEVERIVASPFFTLELKNGAKAVGFPSGAKTGSGAESVRGQKADFIVLDEADYLRSEDLENVIALLMEHSDVMLWVASTPSGKREHFWRFCTERMDFKEFYYPAMVNPSWSKAMELELRAFYQTEIAWAHEICFEENTLIKTDYGTKAIKNITENDAIYNHKGTKFPVLASAKQTGIKDIHSYNTVVGEIQCTPTHNFPNRDFEKQAISQLKELPLYLDYNERYQSTKEEILARLVGWNLGDGTVASTRIQASFYSSIKEDMEQLLLDCKSVFPEIPKSKKVNYRRIKPNKSSLAKVEGDLYTVQFSKILSQKFVDLGCVRGKKVEQVFDVPEWIKNGSNEVKINFLSALFGAEGSTPSVDSADAGLLPHTLTLSMVKRKREDGKLFLNSLVWLLKDLGIASTYTVRSVGKWGFAYTLFISNTLDNLIKFLSLIGYRYCREKEWLSFLWLNYLLHVKACIDTKNRIKTEIQSLRASKVSYKEISTKLGVSISQIYHSSKDRKNNKISRTYREIDHFDNWIKNHLVGDCLFVDVLSSNFLKTAPVWNLTVGTPDHSYLLANNIRTYNCAEFGESATGVFQVAFVDNALADYKYDHQSPKSGWMYSIGVDWNDAANGTKLVVVGLDPIEKTFKVVDKVTVQKAGWTQLSSIQKLTELNRKWHPQVIYVDEGYGNVQIELLRKMGLEAELSGHKVDARLKNIKAINLSSKIDIYDPISQQPSKEWIKPFMVNNAVRRFEQNQILISKYDDLLYKQLLGYAIAKTTITGMPVYVAGPDGDHDLDGLMLALLGFTMELSEFTNVAYNSNIAIAGKFGESNMATEFATATLEGRDPQFEKLNRSRSSKTQSPETRNEKLDDTEAFRLPSAEPLNSTKIYSPEAFKADPRGKICTFTPGMRSKPTRRSF